MVEVDAQQKGTLQVEQEEEDGEQCELNKENDRIKVLTTQGGACSHSSLPRKN
jgi:hypothetical protein